MWLLTGPFDGPLADQPAILPPKTKLLKTGKTYPLGRKNQPLVVAHKRISAEHCTFVVSPHTTDDSIDISQRPTLEVCTSPTRSKGLVVLHKGERIIVEPPDTLELHDGDEVTVYTDFVIKVQWHPLVVYSPSSRPKPSLVEKCAELGIKIAHTPNAQITHHLTPNYTANLSLAASLLSLSQFVKPEWLNEVLRLGTPSDEDTTVTTLEQQFNLPPISKFRPSFSPVLPPSQKVFSVWEPNEERVHLFHEIRFICFSEKAVANDSDLRDVVQRGDGAWEAFDIHSGSTKFRKALVRAQAKEGKNTVIIGDVDAMKLAVGDESWSEYVSEAKTFGLEIHPIDDVTQSVLDAKVGKLNPSAPLNTSIGEDSSIATPSEPPIIIPSESQAASIAEEPEPSRPPRRLPRRATSRASSREPSAPPEPEPTFSQAESNSRPRRALTRRVLNGKPIVAGFDEPSTILSSVPDVQPSSVNAPLVTETPARPSKLKRRVVGGGTTDPFSVAIAETIEDEPPLKKFKALFEATNVDSTEQQTATMDSLQFSTQDQTQSRAENGIPGGLVGSSLTALREEEEESLMSMPTSRRLPKRGLASIQEDEDVDMNSQGHTGEAEPPATKRRAVENVNAVQSSIQVEEPPPSQSVKKPPSTFKKPPSTSKPSKDDKRGAPPGQPDVDTAFLKAIASTKRGKKTEDDFDREFNKLKIAKPELDHYEPEAEWAVLADFGDDTNLRGNFMVVVEMDVSDRVSRKRNEAVNKTWDGKSNFKKFKKANSKIDRASRPKIDLFPSEEGEYGMGKSYWKDGHSQGQSQSRRTQARSRTYVELEAQPMSQVQPTMSDDAANTNLQMGDSEDDEEVAPLRRTTRKAPSREPSVVPLRKRAAKSKPLFLESDDEDEGQKAAPMEVHEDLTLPSSPESKPPPKRSSRSSKPASKAKKPAAIIADDDSDNDAVFRGFRGGRR